MRINVRTLAHNTTTTEYINTEVFVKLMVMLLIYVCAVQTLLVLLFFFTFYMPVCMRAKTIHTRTLCVELYICKEEIFMIQCASEMKKKETKMCGIFVVLFCIFKIEKKIHSDWNFYNYLVQHKVKNFFFFNLISNSKILILITLTSF